MTRFTADLFPRRPASQPQDKRIFGVRRGITSAGRAALVTLGYSEVVISL